MSPFSYFFIDFEDMGKDKMFVCREKTEEIGIFIHSQELFCCAKKVKKKQPKKKKQESS